MLVAAGNRGAKHSGSCHVFHCNNKVFYMGKVNILGRGFYTVENWGNFERKYLIHIWAYKRSRIYMELIYFFISRKTLKTIFSRLGYITVKNQELWHTLNDKKGSK